jgi:hypothetical protein
VKERKIIRTQAEEEDAQDKSKMIEKEENLC